MSAWLCLVGGGLSAQEPTPADSAPGGPSLPTVVGPAPPRVPSIPETLPPLPPVGADGAAPSIPTPPPEDLKGRPLEVDEVLRSVQGNFPLLDAVLRERGIAAGEWISAQGAYDWQIKAESLAAALGFYQTTSTSVGVERLWAAQGARTFAGYKLGRGNYAEWDKGFETNKGGEFRVGGIVPLLQDREIDKPRAELQKNDLNLSSAEAKIAKARIEFAKNASKTYWTWLGEGFRVKLAERFLGLATARNSQLKVLVERGQLADIELLDNQRLLFARQGALTGAERKFQQGSIELSLYLRDPAGRPILVPLDRLPERIPEPYAPDLDALDADIQAAWAQRPEPRLLRLDRRKIGVELALAENQLQPKFNALAVASQDVGEPSSSKRDKSPFKFDAGLEFSVPWERRAAGGRVQAAQQEMAQIAAHERYLADRIAADVRDAYSALSAAYERLRQARESKRVAGEVLDKEQARFRLGGSTILILNLRELALLEAEVSEIDTMIDFFRAVADYRAALGMAP